MIVVAVFLAADGIKSEHHSLQSHLFDEGRQSSDLIRFRLHFVGL